MIEVTPELLLRAYAAGIFPMAEGRDAPALYWIDPDRRGVLPLECFHTPRRLRRTVRAGAFDIRCDTAFDRVIQACAEPRPGRHDTWINPEIIRLYSALNDMGCVHTVECWQGEELVGGLYGVSMGGAFFGESMFSRVRDASKVALVHLAARLAAGGFQLLDTQFTTEHLEMFGALEIPRSRYRQILSRALTAEARFPRDLPDNVLEAFMRQAPAAA